jgi:hypothetical protein
MASWRECIRNPGACARQGYENARTAVQSWRQDRSEQRTEAVQHYQNLKQAHERRLDWEQAQRHDVERYCAEFPEDCANYQRGFETERIKRDNQAYAAHAAEKDRGNRITRDTAQVKRMERSVNPFGSFESFAGFAADEFGYVVGFGRPEETQPPTQQPVYPQYVGGKPLPYKSPRRRRSRKSGNGKQSNTGDSPPGWG